MIIKQVLQRTIEFPVRLNVKGRSIGQTIEDNLIDALHAAKERDEEVIEVTVKLSDEDRLELSH